MIKSVRVRFRQLRWRKGVSERMREGEIQGGTHWTHTNTMCVYVRVCAGMYVYVYIYIYYMFV